MNLLLSEVNIKDISKLGIKPTRLERRTKKQAHQMSRVLRTKFELDYKPDIDYETISLTINPETYELGMSFSLTNLFISLNKYLSSDDNASKDLDNVLQRLDILSTIETREELQSKGFDKIDSEYEKLLTFRKYQEDYEEIGKGKNKKERDKLRERFKLTTGLSEQDIDETENHYMETDFKGFIESKVQRVKQVLDNTKGIEEQLDYAYLLYSVEEFIPQESLFLLFGEGMMERVRKSTKEERDMSLHYICRHLLEDKSGGTDILLGDKTISYQTLNNDLFEELVNESKPKQEKRRPKIYTAKYRK